jgi:hypothetical protein
VTRGAADRLLARVWSELASTLEALLAGADVVVLGYRPASLARLGLDPADLAARHPPGAPPAQALDHGRMTWSEPPHPWGADAARWAE